MRSQRVGHDWATNTHSTHTHTHTHTHTYTYISHFPDPFIHWYYMYSLTVFSNNPHFLLPLILGENLSSCNSCKVSQWPMFKNYIPWNVLCLLLVRNAPRKSLLQTLFESSLTPTLSTMINATSASVVFTKTTVFLDYKINTFTLYKSLRENLKIIKGKVKIKYNQDNHHMSIYQLFVYLWWFPTPRRWRQRIALHPHAACTLTLLLLICVQVF